MSHRPVWRGSLQAAHQSRPRYFSSVDEIPDLLAQLLAAVDEAQQANDDSQLDGG